MTNQASKRGTYGRYSYEDRAQVRCYAAIHGVTSAMRHFEGTIEFPNLKESTVHDWKDEYNKTKKRGHCQPVVRLPTKR